MNFLVLGPVDVVDGDHAPRLGSAKQRLLLAALLVDANAVVSVDRLAEALWGDGPPVDIHGALQTYVSRLRAVLEPERPAGGEGTTLLTRAPGYLLRADREQIDAGRFERLLEAGRGHLNGNDPGAAVTVLDEALALWRGRAYAEFADHEFARTEALRLEELRRLALEDRCEARLDLGDHAQLVAELEALAAADPLRERPRAQLMLALYRCGREGEALRVYQDYRRHLGAELGLEPSTGLSRLEAEILQKQPHLDWTPARPAVPAARTPARAVDPGVAPEPTGTRPRGTSRRERARPTFAVSGDRPAPLVGRREELSWLRTRLELCRAGFPHLVLIEGEAGIGKSRLAQELVADARRAQMQVVTGRGYEQLDLAYLPLRESLLPALAEELDRRDGFEAERELLHQLDGDLDAPAAPTVTGEIDGPEREHSRLLLTLTRLVLELARSTPTVLLVDDVHWADPATLDLLRHLVYRLDGEQVPLMLVATARGDVDARGADGVAKLRREPGCATLLLSPLSELESTDLARRLGTGTAAEAHEVALASGGNPLLVQTLARRGPARRAPASPVGRASASDPVTAAIEDRLGSLTDDAETLVRFAAFLVPDCTRDALIALSGLDAATAAAALEEATRKGVLTGDATELTFAHPLYAHVVYEATTTITRRKLHRDIAMALIEGGDADGTVPVRAIAHHLLAAGPDADRELVADFARRAGDEAAVLAAWSEAARDYEGALATVDDRADPLGASALHRLAGLCQRYALELELALRHFDRAIELCEPLDDAEMLAELHIWRIRCGIGSQALLDVVSEREPLARLVRRIESTAPGTAAQGLVELSQSMWAGGELAEAEQTARAAMELARRAGDHTAFSRAAVALSVPQWMRYDLTGSLATLEEGLEHAREAPDESPLTGPLFRLPLVLTWLGRPADAERLAIEACGVADRLNYPLEEGLPLAALTQLATARGDFDGAERHAHDALLIQRLSGYHWAAGLFLPALASACVARGRFEAARDALATWAETAGPAEEAGIDLFRSYVDAIDPMSDGELDRRNLPRVPRAPMVGADAWAVAIVEIARRGAGTVDVKRAHDLLVEIDRRGGVLTGSLVALVPRVMGVAADLIGDETEAIASLERAMRVGRAIGAEPETARAGFDLATVLARRGDRARAAGLLDEATATFERLGMRPDLERAVELADGAAGRPPSHRPRPALARAAERPLAAAESVMSVILFTDVVDSTRLTEELGDARYRERARRLEDLVLAAISEHDGDVVTGINLGDGFIGLFRSAERAIAAARAAAHQSESTGLHLHLAVHAGDILVDGSRIFGGAVNLAARVCGLTGPDEILVSETVRGLTRTSTDVSFVDRGEHALKGIAEPQRVYALVEGIATDN